MRVEQLPERIRLPGPHPRPQTSLHKQSCPLDRPGFRERCFTEAERTYCDSKKNPAESYAARFAGKEAVGKALGCGVLFTWRFSSGSSS